MFQMRLENFTFNFNTTRNILINNFIYDSYFNPWQSIKMRTNRISTICESVPIETTGLGDITNGDWYTKSCKPISESRTYRSIKAHFVDGIPWCETVYIEKAEEKIIENGEVRGCSTIDEFVSKRCGYIELLYHSIQENGYQHPDSDIQRQYELERKSIKQNLHPLVLLDKYGNVLLRDGKTRFAICDILDEPLHVQILRVHESFFEDIEFEFENVTAENLIHNKKEIKNDYGAV